MRGKKLAWGLITPTLILLTLIGIVPFVRVLIISFFSHNPFSALGKVFIGLDNYRRLVFDEDFLHSLQVGITFVAMVCSIELPLGFAIAELLHRKFIGKGLFRTIFTLPLTIAPITIGSTWVLLTRPRIGPIPRWLEMLGVNYNIGRSSIQAFGTVIAMDVWHWTPLVALTFLAGLTSLPRTPFEAARIDGASRWQILRYLTLPMLKPVLLTILFIRLMDAFKIFDEIWMLTGGGPARATRTISIHIVREVISKTSYGSGAAMSVFVLYITLVVCWLLLAIIQKEVIES